MSNEIISLCYIKKIIWEAEYYGEKEEEEYRLLRIADYVEGEYIPLQQIKKDDKVNHRSELFFNDWPKDESNYGVWKWTAVPTFKHGNSEYIKSSYVKNRSIYPKEIICITAVTSYDELLKALLSKNNYISPIFDDFLLAYKEKEVYYAFYIERGSYIRKGSSIILNNDVHSLAQYEIDENEVFSFNLNNETSKYFYKKAKLDTCKKRYLLGDINEIVFKKIKEKCEWRYAHNKLSLSKNEWRNLQNYLNSINNKDLYMEIASELHVNIEDAKTYVLECIKKLDNYFVDHEDETEVFKNIIISNPVFMASYENEFKKQLENHITEIEEYINELDKEKDAISKKISLTNSEYIKLTGNVSKLRDEKEEIEREITVRKKDLKNLEAQKERAKQFGENIEIEIQNKINQAQQEATKFIANNIWLNVLNQNQANEKNQQLQEKQVTVNAYHDLNRYIKKGEKVIKRRTINSINDQLNLFLDNLANIGLDSEDSETLAYYLYATYLTHNNVLLVGPYGYEIASSLSISIDSYSASRIACNNETINDLNELINQCPSEIVVIDGIIANNFEANISSIQQTNKFLIFTHPYKDDLVLEPFGLFNYLTPIYTDYFIENKIVQNEMVGGVKSEKFIEYKINDYTSQVTKYRKYWKYSAMIKSRNDQIINAYNDLEGEGKLQYYFECCFLPFAYITNQKTKFIEECEPYVGSHYKKIKRYLEIEDE